MGEIEGNGTVDTVVESETKGMSPLVEVPIDRGLSEESIIEFISIKPSIAMVGIFAQPPKGYIPEEMHSAFT
jgi:hypothetical protein